jgi:hypothetical protein
LFCAFVFSAPPIGQRKTSFCRVAGRGFGEGRTIFEERRCVGREILRVGRCGAGRKDGKVREKGLFLECFWHLRAVNRLRLAGRMGCSWVGDQGWVLGI